MPGGHFSDFHRVDAIVRSALEQPSTDQSRYIEKACGSDTELLNRVRALLSLALDETSDLAPGAGLLALGDENLADRADAARTGDRYGPWRIIEEIGRGGMAAVYRAERADGAYRQQVAIKLLHGACRYGRARDRFERERSLLARLAHPNIARLLDGGTTDEGLSFIVMEYVEGEPIDRYCDTRRLSVDARLKLFLRVCEAVQFAHRQLIVHRDIKPGNILVSAEGVPKLLDFGIAKLLESDEQSIDAIQTAWTQRMLTPQYASPEQFLGEPVSTATDVYALGLLLYELLSGHRARRIDPTRSRAIERAICETQPAMPSQASGTDRPAGRCRPARSAAQIASDRRLTTRRLRRRLRGDLDNIVMMALRREPERRYATAQQLAEDVAGFLGMRPVRARPDSLVYRLDRYLHRHAVGVSAAAAALVAIVLTVGFYTEQLAWERDAAREAAERARIESARAEQVSSFLTSLFEASRPDEALGRELSARDLLEQGVQRLDTLSAEPEIQARVLSVIGKTRHRLGDLSKAETLFRRALSIRSTLFGSNHVQVAESLNDLGVVLKDRGRLDGAETILRQAVDMRRNLPDESEASLAISVEELGRLLREQGRLLEARRLFEEGLAIRRRVYGQAHSETLSSLNSVAMMHRDLGDPERALDLFQELVAGYQEVKGERHPWTAAAMANMAHALMDLERWDDAERTLQSALSIERDTLGPEHVGLAVTLHHLGSAHRGQGRLEASRTALTEAVRLGRAAWGESHPRLAGFLLNLGRTELRSGNLAAADDLLRQSVAMHRSSFAEGDWRTAEAIGWLGELEARQGRFEEAESLMLAGHAALLKRRGAGAALTRRARERIIHFYMDQGKAAAAETFRTQTTMTPER